MRKPEGTGSVPQPPSTEVGLAPLDWAVLVKTIQQKGAGTIAQECGLKGPQEVQAILLKPAFQKEMAATQEAIGRQVARGEFGVLAFFKKKLPWTAKSLFGLARDSKDERIRLQALVRMQALGGLREPEPMVTESVSRVLDNMTADELDHFAKTKEFPERFRDQLARLATSQLEKVEVERWRPKVEIIGEEESHE